MFKYIEMHASISTYIHKDKWFLLSAVTSIRGAYS